MNWELITQGFELSVMGILTTFSALGLFIGTILLLRMVFPTEPRKPKTQTVEESVAVEETDVDTDNDEDAVFAAISAAIYVQSMLAVTPDDGTLAAMDSAFVPQLYGPRRKGLGARLEQPRGRWWQPINGTENQGK